MNEYLTMLFVVACYMFAGFGLLLLSAFIIEVGRFLLFGKSSLPRIVKYVLINIFRDKNIPYYDIKMRRFLS